MRYIPAPVIEGFIAGIAAVIFLQQIPSALGVATPDKEGVAHIALEAAREFAAAPAWPAVSLSLGVALLILIGMHLRPRVPFSLIAIAIATIVAITTDMDVHPIGDLPSSLPLPSIGFLQLDVVPDLLTAALAIAALGALESLLSATVADGMAGRGERHNPDKELFGQGLANIASPLFGHALVLAAIMFAFAPFVARVPMAALAGVLLATCVRMVEVGALARLGRTTRSDAVIMILTCVATVALDIVQAVLLGLALTVILSVQKIAQDARIEVVPLEDEGRALHRRLDEHIAAYRIEGPLFFAAAHRFATALTDNVAVRAIILRMERVSTVDATGALILHETVGHLESHGVAVFLTELRPGHDRPLRAVGLLGRLEERRRLHARSRDAVAAARAHVTDTPPHPPEPAPAVG
jgi:SulP family sulfate permease